ncbi:MAG: VWA domain-containing protein, partial [Candidatus Kapaibacteriota bacterium]
MKKKVTIFLIFFVVCGKFVFSQYLSVFDFNSSNFPIVKSKFFVFDTNYNVLTNFNLNNFSVQENGVVRQVLSVQCPLPKAPQSISSVLVMDVSGSMNYPVPRNIDLAVEAGIAWIKGLPNSIPWECAITAFDNRNYLIKDFTSDRDILINSIRQLVPNGGTNYDAAFIDLSAGAIPIAKSGKYKRIVVFLSDGQPNLEPQTEKIIQEAKNLNISVYGVTLRMPAPRSIKDICEQTGGTWFENISSVEQAKAIYLTILQLAQGKLQPCEIEWLGDTSCTTVRNVKITYLPANVSDTLNYEAPVSSLTNLEITPSQLVFGHIVPPSWKDTTVQIIASNGDINVQQIQITHPRFTIQNYGGTPPPFKLSKGESRTLTVRYTAPDSGFVTAWLKITSDACISSSCYLAAGFQDKIPDISLRLIHPNGGEEFLVGIDTVFTWEGVLPSDTVILEYSTDAGVTWNLISEKATGLRYVWKRVPNTQSRRCLG